MGIIKRVIWIVLDSVGMGALPDAERFGDAGANTIGNIAKVYKELRLPVLRKLGYGNIDGMQGIDFVESPIGCYGRLKELSNGKDTTTGHWEMIGIETKVPFPTYPDGFPAEIINAFIEQTKVPGILGNIVASGTTIINALGDEHMVSGKPIIYTSADSVFQIAASEALYPPEKLYEMCRIARALLQGEHNVARVIARPFVKEGNLYVRTANRRDFSRKPAEENLLTYIKRAGKSVYAIGKIEDIFDGVGITDAVHTKDNMDGMNQTMDALDVVTEGLIFTNLVEFDSKWGHRRDVKGYAEGLMSFDERLGELLEKLSDSDVLVITADHGCDPTYQGTDHTREYVPVLYYGHALKKGVNLHTGDSFADTGCTVADMLGVQRPSVGQSVYHRMK